MKTDHSDWPQHIIGEFERNQENPRVGSTLVSETDRARVWTISLKPGERLGFHKHVLDYFWTVMTNGKARSHRGDGSTVEVEYKAGDTKHLTYARGKFMIHDLENSGDTELLFTTVEFKDSANAPLPLTQLTMDAREAKLV
jgi:beta-alanine degradation protein BauB